MRGISYDFDGETVIVTGAASGIGRATALAFGSAGATVLIADIREQPRGEATTPTHEAIKDDGGTATFVETDVSDPEAIAALVDAATKYGGVDVMMNNAGIIDRSPPLEVTPEAAERIWSINVNGVLFGCQHAAADMIERGDPGVIVNTASVNSNLAMFDHVLYDATKGAVRMVTRNAALEFAEHDIRVNAVAPGYVGTNLSEDGPEALHQAVKADELIKPIPMGRAGQPDEIASTILFLCCDAASYVTGEAFHVDGGYQIL